MVLNITEMPIKCPVASLEFLFLADWFFHDRSIRDNVEIVFATPLPGAFTKPRASSILGNMLEEKGIAAATVSHNSARIGDSKDTYENGVISHVNNVAASLKISVGMTVKDVCEVLLKPNP